MSNDVRYPNAGTDPFTVCGGVQANTAAQDVVLLNYCTISGCTASGNGGGVYVTIRGNLEIQNSTVQDCRALDSGTPSLGDNRITEGMGGGVHLSAGGYVHLQDGTVLQRNAAAENGGGLSIKSGGGYIDGSTMLSLNTANGSTTYGHGNGAGIFVTTSLYDDDPPLGAGNGAATLYQEDGSLSLGSGVSLDVEQNSANRWGGGLYVGLSPAVVGSSTGTFDQAKISLIGGIVRDNNAGQLATQSTTPAFFPSQITVENVGPSYPAVLDFDSMGITGDSLTDIGIYLWNSMPPSTASITYGTLAVNLVTAP